MPAYGNQTAMSREREAAKSTREHLTRVASNLFFRDGIHAVGVDAIATAAGVAKTTLYYYFKTKDDLVLAHLEWCNANFWRWFESATAGKAQPRARLLRLFVALAELVQDPTCFGCPFMNAAAEFIDPSHPGHAAAIAHKDRVRERLADLSREARAINPEALADHLLLVMDGAFASCRMYGRTGPARHVEDAAVTLIGAALPKR